MPGILMPDLGYAVGEGAILAWLKSVGEPIAIGEAVVEFALEKTVHVLVAGSNGVLLAVYAPPGAVVPEGETLGWIGEAGEAAPESGCRIVAWEEEIAPRPEALGPLPGFGTGDIGGDFGGSAGSAGEPARLKAEPPEKIGATERNYLKGHLRQVTARRMAKSWVDAPKVDLFAEVEFSRVVDHRKALKADGQTAPSYNIYIAHAVVKAFEDLPQFNLQLLKGRETRLQGIHVGLAVSLGDNLVTVSMKDLSGVGLLEIQSRFKGLIRKALRMSLTREELYGSSLTVTNLGEFDVTAFTAVINPPESFILAIGKVEERVIAREGAAVVAPMCTFCLSFDHRIIDGAPASRLLQKIKQHMEGEQGPL